MRTLIVFLLPGLSPAAVFACRFAKDAEPAQWFEWSSALFAGDVASIETDPDQALDRISVRIVETFRGPPAGARVLVALNPNGDTLLVPLTEAYAARLRAQPSLQ